MKLQVLVSTMNQSDRESLLGKMNIHSDAIIINQCDKNRIEEFNHEGYTIRFFSLAERGVGLSRNTALMRADADICLFADDDLTYVDNYKDIVIDSFNKYSDADVIFFNVPSTNKERPTYEIKEIKRVNLFNSLRYGAVNIAIRTSRIKEANVYFSLLFGGGATYSAGEDSIFISECIKKGLKAYSNPAVIGYVSQLDSSWYNGYTDKYFIDKGVFYRHLSKRWAYFLCLQFAIRHRSIFIADKNWVEALTLMLKGVKNE